MNVKLSNTEWEVMETLWQKAPLSASEVFDALPPSTTSNPNTVRTLLDRMLKKNAVRREKRHGVWVFFAAVDRAACLERESRSFIERFFNADAVPLVAHLVEQHALSDDELDRLQALIDDHRGKRRGERSHD